jgi:hypothetical protein
MSAANSIDYHPVSGVGKYKLLVSGRKRQGHRGHFFGSPSLVVVSGESPAERSGSGGKGGSHTESWYGFFSMFLAQKYYPDTDIIHQKPG